MRLWAAVGGVKWASFNARAGIFCREHRMREMVWCARSSRAMGTALFLGSHPSHARSMTEVLVCAYWALACSINCADDN